MFAVVGESTVYRHLDTVTLLVGAESPLVEKAKAQLEQVMIRVTRAAHLAAASERLPVVMPQAVVLFGSFTQEEREHLIDRATAIGALVFYVDDKLPVEDLDPLVEGIAKAAVERGLTRDQPLTRPENTVRDP